MNSLIAAAAMAAPLVLCGAAAAQDAQPQTPPQQQQQQQQQNAQAQIINTYANLLFGREVQKRCKHLKGDTETKFVDDVTAIDRYMQEALPEEIVKAVKEKVKEASADEKALPCGDKSKTFVTQLASAAGEISGNIESQKQKK